MPVDSEHSALAQCLRSGSADEVARLVLTASGGPFRGWAAADLESVTPEQAGAHPTWSMGPMNTLNSASLVNKGLELIETHLLFGVAYDRIDVVVHPQSIVHSMVTFTDGSTIAQASPPDMKLPIALALGWPDRVAGAAAACDFTTASTWEFEPLDAAVFPAVDLARQAGRAGGCLTAVYNAANEEAAAAFLDGTDPASRRSCEQSLTSCTPPTSGPQNRLPWKTYSTRSDGPGNAPVERRRTGGRCNPMMFALGIVLFALAILVSVALHECGHMWVARATGMKVRRYFVGFGPTLWSTMRPNRLGYTEYGLKAVPLGGFCDIAGMTSVEELAPEDEPYAMYKQKTWKRVAVLFAGPAMNFIIGLVLIYGIAVVWGLPNLHPPTTAIVGETILRQGRSHQGQARRLHRAPARPRAAGIQAGDVVVKVGATDVKTFDEMVTAVQKSSGPTPFVVERTAERRHDVDRPPSSTSAPPSAGSPRRTTARQPARPTSAPSASAPPSSARRSTTRCPPSRPPSPSPATSPSRLGKSLAAIPTKVGALVHAIGGGERDPGDARSASSAPASSAATPSTTGCGWRSGSSWPSSTSCSARSTWCRCCRSTAATSRSPSSRRSAT